MKITYFGTTLDCAGHYFFDISNGKFEGIPLYFKDIDFNPEEYPLKGMRKGDGTIFQTGSLTVMYMAGSPFDKRNGCKSVFWVNGLVPAEILLDILYENSIFRSIYNILNPTEQII